MLNLIQHFFINSMNSAEVLKKTIDFVKKELREAEGGHDWFHIQRVYNVACQIAKEENCNVFVVQLGALLHDIADSKFHGGDEEKGPETARSFLEKQLVDRSTTDHVIAIIRNISYKGGNTQRTFSSLELDIVQDADRLDAIGAIGVARAFNYGGFKNRPLYDPLIPPVLTMSKEEYKRSSSPTINHFYEKLLLLKDKLNTTAAKRIAEGRHRFMEQYLEQFYAEWLGSDIVKAE